MAQKRTIGLPILVKLTLVVFLANISLLAYSGSVWGVAQFAPIFQKYAKYLSVTNSVAVAKSDENINREASVNIDGVSSRKKTSYMYVEQDASDESLLDNCRDGNSRCSEEQSVKIPANNTVGICDFAKYFIREKRDLFPFKKNARWPETEGFLCEPKLDNLTKKTFLVFVESAPGNFEKRRIIRRTWASTGYYKKNRETTAFLVTVIFVIGVPGPRLHRNEVRDLTARLGDEMELRRDILLINMSDHYDHLTYKGIAALTWIKQHTSHQVTHIFKTDDDSFVNIMGWMTIIIRLGRVTRSPSYIVGTKCVYHSAVVRDPKIRPNPVTFREYPKRFYPPYCMGSGYLMSRAAMIAMLDVIPKVRFLRVEDVYFTGLVAIAANITRYWTSSITERESIQLIHSYNTKSMPLIVHHLSSRPKFWEFLWFMNIAAYDRSPLQWNKYQVKYFAGPHAGIDNLS